MKHLYRCILYFLLIGLIVVLEANLILGIESCVDFLIDIAGIGDKREVIHTIVGEVLPLAIYGALLILILTLIFALYKEKAILKQLSTFVTHWITAFKNLFSSLSLAEVFGVLVVPFVASLYFANTIAVSYDEAITYNYFTSKPFFYCMIFYPYPNNHVLHSLLTNLTEYIPFVGVLFSIRIPAIIAALFTWLIGYSFLKKYYTSRVAFLVVGLASAFEMSIYYSFMSRGYAFIVLAFVVCMYAAFNIIEKGSKNKDWMFFVVAGILGCYTIPSFLYPFATLNVLILVYKYKNIKQQFWANLIAGIWVFLLYLPIILVDGVAALTSNQFVQNIDRMDILRGIHMFYLAMIGEISGAPYWIALLLVVPLLFTIVQKDKKHLLLWLIFLLAPFALIILHAVNPFYRTFLYYNFVICFLVVVPFKKYLEKIPKTVLIIPIILIQLFSIYVFNSEIKIKEGFNTDAANVSEAYFKDDGRTIVMPCISSANYEYESLARGLSDKIHFLNNEAASADTLTTGYDYVIIGKGRDRTINRKPIDSFEHQNIYKNER